MKITVEDEHFRYLSVQKGSLSHLIGRPSLWLKEYEESLWNDFNSMQKLLPKLCRSILDVGSGLGGIDILLNRYYGGVKIELLDGEDDPPVMRLHRETFNNMTVARDFLQKNGVEDIETWTPLQTTHAKPSKNDLIISLGSWCFHYPPESYLNFVMSKCHPATIIIVDVRSHKRSYIDTLESKFDVAEVLTVSKKAMRVAFKPKANNAGNIVPLRLSGVVA